MEMSAGGKRRLPALAEAARIYLHDRMRLPVADSSRGSAYCRPGRPKAGQISMKGNSSAMNLKSIQVSLDAREIQTILAIALDEDRDAALAFIRNRLVKKVEKRLRRH